jgi:hypothetical protein
MADRIKIKKGTWVAIFTFGCLFSGVLALFPMAVQAGTQVYQDPKGFFSFAPPSGWVEKVYPHDRHTRLRFSSPDGKASIVMWARPANAREATFEKFLAEKRQLFEKMKKGKPHLNAVMTETTFCGHRCIEIEARQPGKLVQNTFLYLDQGLHFHVGYSAANQQDFEVNKERALTALCTIKPIKR